MNRLKTLSSSWTILVYCLVCCTELGCVTTKRAAIEPAADLSKKARSIFDLPIYRVDIRGYRMYEALDELSKAIERASHGRVRFVFQLSSIGGAREAREWLQKYGTTPVWPIPGPLNPYVSVRAENTNLRRIVDSLCQQSGWIYNEAITPVGYVFIVRERPEVSPTPNPKVRATQ
jgi:hypothetical protein